MNQDPSDVLAGALSRLHIGAVFGIPGTQTVPLFEALRRCKSIRTVLASDERGAAFMANGHYRASGRPAAVVTIPGPGLTNALTGIAEAREDSVPLLHIVVSGDEDADRRYPLQPVHAESLAPSIYKAAHVARLGADLLPALTAALEAALTGEPGPVLLEIQAPALRGHISADLGSVHSSKPAAPSAAVLSNLRSRLTEAGGICLLVGQGAQEASEHVQALAENLHCPVVTNCSGRGVIPEDHPLNVCADFTGWGSDLVSELFESTDLILAIGCKFSHNGSSGYRLRLPQDRVVQIDTSSDVMGANYPVSLAIEGDAACVLQGLLAQLGEQPATTDAWSETEIKNWKDKFRAERVRTLGSQQELTDAPGLTPGDLFEALGQLLPAESCVVTDSGQHQIWARACYDVLCPRGLIVPADFQSMGFAIPAGIGACVARPERPVVVITGDGGFLMSATSLTVAVREHVPLTVIVFNDGALTQIRSQQLANYGHEFATRPGRIEYESFAKSVGAEYARLGKDLEKTLSPALANGKVSLLELRLRDDSTVRWQAARTRTREALKRAIGPGMIERLRKARDGQRNTGT